jgi:hypothetical protein
MHVFPQIGATFEEFAWDEILIFTTKNELNTCVAGYTTALRDVLH